MGDWQAAYTPVVEKCFSQQISMPVCCNYYLFKSLMFVLPEGKAREQNHWKRLARIRGKRPWVARSWLGGRQKPGPSVVEKMRAGLDYERFLLPDVWLCLADLLHLAVPSTSICCDESSLSVAVCTVPVLPWCLGSFVPQFSLHHISQPLASASMTTA